MIERNYSLNVEGKKRALVDKVLDENCSPLVVLRYDQGVVLATINPFSGNPFSGIKKIREVYPGIVLGATGEIVALDMVYERAVHTAYYGELVLSQKDVKADQIAKEIARVIWQNFVSAGYRPIVCEFVMTDGDAVLTVSYDGSWEEVGDWAVLASESKREAIETQLSESDLAKQKKDHFGSAATLSEATELVYKILGKKNIELISLAKRR